MNINIISTNVFCISCGAKKIASPDAPKKLKESSDLIGEIRYLTNSIIYELERDKPEIAPSILERLTGFKTPLRDLLEKEFVCNDCLFFISKYPLSNETRPKGGLQNFEGAAYDLQYDN